MARIDEYKTYYSWPGDVTVLVVTGVSLAVDSPSCLQTFLLIISDNTSESLCSFCRFSLPVCSNNLSSPSPIAHLATPDWYNCVAVVACKE